MRFAAACTPADDKIDRQTGFSHRASSLPGALPACYLCSACPYLYRSKLVRPLLYVVIIGTSKLVGIQVGSKCWLFASVCRSVSARDQPTLRLARSSLLFAFTNGSFTAQCFAFAGATLNTRSSAARALALAVDVNGVDGQTRLLRKGSGEGRKARAALSYCCLLLYMNVSERHRQGVLAVKWRAAPAWPGCAIGTAIAWQLLSDQLLSGMRVILLPVSMATSQSSDSFITFS